jgi:hypothetical protein
MTTTTDRDISTTEAIDLLLTTAAANLSGLIGSTSGNAWEVRNAARRALAADRLIFSPASQGLQPALIAHSPFGSVTWLVRPGAPARTHQYDPWTNSTVTEID